MSLKTTLQSMKRKMLQALGKKIKTSSSGGPTIAMLKRGECRAGGARG